MADYVIASVGKVLIPFILPAALFLLLLSSMFKGAKRYEGIVLIIIFHYLFGAFVAEAYPPNMVFYMQQGRWKEAEKVAEHHNISINESPYAGAMQSPLSFALCSGLNTDHILPNSEALIDKILSRHELRIGAEQLSPVSCLLQKRRFDLLYKVISHPGYSPSVHDAIAIAKSGNANTFKQAILLKPQFATADMVRVIKTRFGHWNSPLRAAVIRRDQQMVRFLLTYTASDPNQKFGNRYLTSLACPRNESTALLEELLQSPKFRLSSEMIADGEASGMDRQCLNLIRSKKSFR